MAYTSALQSFAWFPNYEASINALAGMAMSEAWDFTDAKVKTNAILKSYLEHTFRRLKQQSKLSYTHDNKYACFNTGLVTRHYEDIFAFCEANRSTTHQIPYVLKAFLKKSDRELLQHFPDALPDTANYFEEPELLIFNPRLELVPQYDHIIDDNRDRFPSYLRNTDSNDVRKKLIGSIDEAKIRVKLNYKLAVPQCFNGRIQLLIPLVITDGSSSPDLALVVEKISAKAYTARTCLTLKMAYQNARLIVRPDSHWLKP
jgi:hypothetical protein